ncbi:MAG TPA: preprotein translocase subunit SecE [Flavobacteriia bacterium]|nr:preprotein translocase subunit SecE [Flavobacteriia bacterium]
MGIVNYIKESYKELTQEVTWISLEEAQKQTILVVVFTLVFSLAVFITDKTIQSMLDNLYRLFV